MISSTVVARLFCWIDLVRAGGKGGSASTRLSLLFRLDPFVGARDLVN